MSESNYMVIRQLGLSKATVACYEALFKGGGTDAANLAQALGCSRTGLYRLLKDLEAKGFLESVKTEPYVTYYYAETLEKALANYAGYQERLVWQLINEQREVMAKRSGKSRRDTP